MPRNGRSARAGAVRAAGLLSGKSDAALSSLAVAAGGGFKVELRRGNDRIGRSRKRRYLRVPGKARKQEADMRGAGSPRLNHGIRSVSATASAGPAVSARAEMPRPATRSRFRSASVCPPPRCRRRVPASRLLELQTPTARASESSARPDAARRRGFGDRLQRLPRLAARRREIAVAERRIGDHRDAVTLAPRQSPHVRWRAPADDKAPGCRRSCPCRPRPASRRGHRYRNCSRPNCGFCRCRAIARTRRRSPASG